MLTASLCLIAGYLMARLLRASEQYWAVERIWQGEAPFMKPVRTGERAWEFVAFGWRLFVAVPRSH
jgi:hypothetical protein